MASRDDAYRRDEGARGRDERGRGGDDYHHRERHQRDGDRRDQRHGNDDRRDQRQGDDSRLAYRSRYYDQPPMDRAPRGDDHRRREDDDDNRGRDDHRRRDDDDRQRPHTATRPWDQNRAQPEGFFEARRLEREAASVADKLWPPSPDAPYRSPSPPPRRHKSDGKSRHKHKHKKGSGKSKSSSKRDSKHHKSSTSKRHHHRRSKEDVSAAARGDSESDDRGSVASSVVSSSRKRARTSRRRSRSVASSRSRSSVSRSSSRSRSPRRDGATGASIAPVAATDDADMWVEKKVGGIAGEEQEVVGPRPLFVPDASKAIGYGAALLPGEGAAMAAFVQEGKRIPRRGEIGLSSDQIASYEDQGYVMSGSRHHMMNAIRIRKENQIISAEEKRQLIAVKYEEKLKRENKIVADFKDIVQDKMESVTKGGGYH